MVERKEAAQKHAIIFVIFDGQKIQLEERIEASDKYFGYTLIPGGKLEPGDTLESGLKREIREEYGINVVKSEELGVIQSMSENGVNKFKHVFLVSKWEGNLSNPEKRNVHIEATFQEARKICKHPISQKILDLVESKLLGQNS